MKKDSYYYWYVDKCGGIWKYRLNQISNFIYKLKVKLNRNPLDRYIYDAVSENNSYRILSVLRLSDKKLFSSGQTVEVVFNNEKRYKANIDYFRVDKDGVVVTEFKKGVGGYIRRTGLQHLTPLY